DPASPDASSGNPADGGAPDAAVPADSASSDAAAGSAPDAARDSTRGQASSAAAIAGIDECAPDVLCGGVTADDGYEVRFTLVPAVDPGEAKGLMVLHFGGPGTDASDIVPGWRGGHPNRRLVSSFDVLGVRQRGTGAADGLDCGNDEILHDILTGRVAATDPDRAERLAREWMAGCPAGRFDTVTAASDIAAVVSHLDAGRTVFVGYSYGGVVGALLAIRHPDVVDAVVLDSPALGILDPYAGPRQVESFEAALANFTDNCDRTRDCRFAPDGDAGERFRRFARSYDAPGDLLFATGLLLYNETTAPQLDEMLTAALAGDTTQVTEYADVYHNRFGRDYPSSTEIFPISVCADEIDDFTDDPAVARETYRELGILGELAAVAWSPTTGSCAAWRGESVPFTLDLSDAAADVILVASRDDPAVPWKTLKPFIDSSLPPHAGVVLVDGAFHGLWGSGNLCVETAVDAFVLDGTTPSATVECGDFG
ncbi:MAG TPA: hypothetical protein DEP66_01870, partial [Acidimicrobiaceae bacterium]|nr:hypothetical protein [Acidimicrobiaceae bacterium]